MARAASSGKTENFFMVWLDKDFIGLFERKPAPAPEREPKK